MTKSDVCDICGRQKDDETCKECLKEQGEDAPYDFYDVISHNVSGLLEE